MIYVWGPCIRVSREAELVGYVCVCVCVCVCIHIWKEIYYKELALEIMETEKSQNLQSANWKPRRANDVFLV